MTGLLLGVLRKNYQGMVQNWLLLIWVILLKKRVVPLAQSLKSNFTLNCDVEKKEDVHKMAESNKAFAHFRW